MKVVDLLKEQELLKAKYFAETEQGFILEVEEGQDTEYLSEQIKKHYEEVSNALNRYMEIEDILSKVYASTYIQVLGHQFTVATGIKLLHEMTQVVKEPVTRHIVTNYHPMSIFLSMCSAPSNFYYSSRKRGYLDPLGLKEDLIIEDVLYKVEEFLTHLRYAIEKSIQETEV